MTYGCSERELYIGTVLRVKDSRRQCNHCVKGNVITMDDLDQIEKATICNTAMDQMQQWPHYGDTVISTAVQPLPKGKRPYKILE